VPHLYPWYFPAVLIGLVEAAVCTVIYRHMRRTPMIGIEGGALCCRLEGAERGLTDREGV
jgi:hypothetical protein